VRIPSDATTLNYWYQSASEDMCGYDYAYVRFDSTTLQAYDLCEDASTSAWTSQQVDVTAWRGQTVQVSFTAQTDGSLNSNFFLDDVTISTGATSPALSVLSDAPLVPPAGASRPKQSP
jgi:bacillopeptidase F (M6 metalloprotease family)